MYRNDDIFFALQLAKDRASGRLNYWRPGAGKHASEHRSLTTRIPAGTKRDDASVRADDRQALLEAMAHIVEDAVAPLADEVASLRDRVKRPDLVKYTVNEACARLKRSRSSLYNLLQQGELVPVKEAGRTYLTEEECQRWERTQRN